MIISPSNTSKNIGLVFDDKLSFKNHISSITNSSNFHISELKKYGHHFPETLLKLYLMLLYFPELTTVLPY